MKIVIIFFSLILFIVNSVLLDPVPRAPSMNDGAKAGNVAKGDHASVPRAPLMNDGVKAKNVTKGDPASVPRAPAMNNRAKAGNVTKGDPASVPRAPSMNKKKKAGNVAGRPSKKTQSKCCECKGVKFCHCQNVPSNKDRKKPAMNEVEESRNQNHDGKRISSKTDAKKGKKTQQM